MDSSGKPYEICRSRLGLKTMYGGGVTMPCRQVLGLLANMFSRPDMNKGVHNVILKQKWLSIYYLDLKLDERYGKL